MFKELEIYKKGLVKIELILSFNSRPFFRLSVPNKTYCHGLFTCIKMALSDLASHEIDETKYEYLKELKHLRRERDSGVYITSEQNDKIREGLRIPVIAFLDKYAPLEIPAALSNIHKPINGNVKNERERLRKIASKI